MKDGSVCGMYVVTQCNEVIGGWNKMPPSSDSEWLGWRCFKVMGGVKYMAVTQHQCLGRGGEEACFHSDQFGAEDGGTLLWSVGAHLPGCTTCS